jgi:small subunit ribosomal protein S17
MADEEKNETTEEQADAPEQEGAPAEEAPKEPSADAPDPDGPAGEAEEPAADADPAGEAEEPAVDDAPPAAASPAAGGDDEEVDWKTRRRLERSRQPAEARPQRSNEQRAADREARRTAAAAERSRYRKRARTKGEKGTGTPPAERISVDRKMRQGTVVSSKPDKTITVRIDVARRHPVYEKVVRKTGTLHAHDERNEAAEGDLVRIVETRPISKLKRWRLEQILEKAK